MQQMEVYQMILRIAPYRAFLKHITLVDVFVPLLSVRTVNTVSCDSAYVSNPNMVVFVSSEVNEL